MNDQAIFNCTPTPNSFFSQVIPVESEVVVKLIGAVIFRAAAGEWPVNNTVLCDAAGISMSSLKTALHNARVRGYLALRPLGDAERGQLSDQVGYPCDYTLRLRCVDEPVDVPRGRPGFVYLALAGTGHYKIGRSTSPRDRIRVFDTKMPVSVKVVHTIACDDAILAEKTLHDLFASKRHRGEWFALDDEDVAQIRGYVEFRSGFTGVVS
jgi:hypothetical protein